MRLKVCIVLPCFKVKNKILKVYQKLKKKNFDCIIFVDDNCPQKSVSFLKSKIKSDKKKIRFLFLKKNLGVGGATMEGFALADKMKFNIIIKFDSDNQHRVTDLMKIINKLSNNNVDFCKGYRILNIKKSLKRNMPVIRILGANALTFISNFTTGNFYIKDVTNGLFGMKSKIIKKINFNSLKKNYFFEQDLIYRVCQKKIKIYQVKSEVIYKDELSSLSIVRCIVPFMVYHVQNFLSRFFIRSI